MPAADSGATAGTGDVPSEPGWARRCGSPPASRKTFSWGGIMFKPRLLTTMATLAFVTGMLGGGPAMAQAPLGFTIAPTQGLPGDTVTGQVNAADVTASCVTDLTALQARFDDLINNVMAFFAPDPLWLRFFPPDVTDIITTIQTHDQLAYTVTLLVALGISANINGAAETALPQTFVMTFADLATQKPI